MPHSGSACRAVCCKSSVVLAVRAAWRQPEDIEHFAQESRKLTTPVSSTLRVEYDILANEPPTLEQRMDALEARVIRNERMLAKKNDEISEAKHELVERQVAGERVFHNLMRTLFGRWDARLSLALILAGLVLQTLAYVP